MNKLLSNVVVTYAASGLGFVITMLMARLLGAEQYALVALGLAFGGFITPVASLGSQATFVRDAVTAGNINSVREMAEKSFGMRFTATLLTTLLVMIGGSFYTSKPAEIVPLCCFSLWAGLQGLYPTSWFDYTHTTKMQNSLVLIERLIAVLLVAFLYFFENYRAHMHVALLGALLLTSRISSIAYQVQLWWKINGGKSFRIRLIFPTKSIEGINFRVTLTLIANAVLSYGNQLLLAGKNSIELAAYSLAFQLITLIFLFQTLIIRLLSRKIADVISTNQQIRYTFTLHAGATTVASALLGGAAFIFTLFLPNLLTDTRYAQMINYMPILWLWITIVGAGQVITQYMLVLRQESFYVMSGIIGGLLAFGMGLLFVPNNGAIAVSIILLVVHSTMITANFIRLMLAMKQKEKLS